MAVDLRLREWAAVFAAGAFRIAQGRPSSSSQSPAPAISGSVPPDAPVDADRSGPDPDPAHAGGAAVGRAEEIAAATGGEDRSRSGSRDRTSLMPSVIS